MILQLINRDPAWKFTPWLTAAAAIAALFNSRYGSSILGAMAGLIVVLLMRAQPHRRVTFFEASLPISARDLLLARFLSLMALIWLPAAASSGGFGFRYRRLRRHRADAGRDFDSVHAHRGIRRPGLGDNGMPGRRLRGPGAHAGVQAFGSDTCHLRGGSHHIGCGHLETRPRDVPVRSHSRLGAAEKCRKGCTVESLVARHPVAASLAVGHHCSDQPVVGGHRHVAFRANVHDDGIRPVPVDHPLDSGATDLAPFHARDGDRPDFVFAGRERRNRHVDRVHATRSGPGPPGRSPPLPPYGDSGCLGKSRLLADRARRERAGDSGAVGRRISAGAGPRP